MPRSKRLVLPVASLALVLALAAPRPVRAAFTESAAAFGIAAGDSMSYGASFPDLDGDGDADFYANLHWSQPGELWINGGAPWTRILPSPLVGPPDRHDDLWGDFDNDGSPDVYICHGGDQANELLWNGGAGLFTEGATAAGAADVTGRGRELTLLDADNDGWLDIYVANDQRPGFVRPNVLLYNNGDGTFSRFPNTASLFSARIHVSSADYDGDGDPDIITTNPPYVDGEFWRNDGALAWVNVTSTVFPGISLPLKQANGLSWADYDNDGDLDLLTCGGNRAMWDYAAVEGDSVRYYAETVTAETKTIRVVTNGDSVTVWAVKSDYQPVTLWYGSQQDSTEVFPVTLAIADVMGMPARQSSGTRRGMFLGGYAVAGGDSLRLAVGGAAPGADLIVGGSLRTNGSMNGFAEENYAIRPGFSQGDFRNRLYRNEGDGTFHEVTATAFPVNPSNVPTLAATWGDYDNDGWIDVYLSNSGNIETGNLPNLLLRNKGDGTFDDVTAAEGVAGSTRGLTDGAGWVDANRDGSLDLFVANGAEHPPFGVGPRELFVNAADSGNHWMEIQLRGLDSNGSGIGARVRVVTSAGEQFRWRLGESDNCFSEQTILHFGLGQATVADTVQVFWPSGLVDTFVLQAVDARYWAIEGKPLRPAQNPHFIVAQPAVGGYLNEGQTKTWTVRADNFGGVASTFHASLEACDGSPVPWLAVSPDTGAVWPGGRDLSIRVDATGLATGVYCGRVVFTTNGFTGGDSLTVNMTVLSSSVDAPVVGDLPAAFSLGAPRPNPSHGPVDVQLALPRKDRVKVEVVGVDGRRVATLAEGELPAGRHVLTWDRRDESGARVASGVYFLRADAVSGHGIRKVTLID